MRKIAGAIAVVGVLCLAPASALAAADPGWFEGHSAEEREAIVNYAYRRAGHETMPYAGDAADLAEEMADAAAGAEGLPLAPDLGRQELSTLQLVGLVAPTPVLVPRLAAGLAMFGATVVIGDLVMDLQAPDDAGTGGESNWSWGSVSWRDHGDELWAGGTVQQRPGAYLYDHGNSVIMWDEHPCPYSGFMPTAGARLQTGVGTSGECQVWVRGVPVLYPVFLDYPYLLASDITPVAPLRPFEPETDDPDYFLEPEPDPGLEVVEEQLDVLDDDGNELLRGQIDHHLTPGAQPEEEPIWEGTRLTAEERACKAYFGEAGQGDPGRRSPEAAPEAPDWDYDVDEFEGVYNPLTRSTQTVKLRWGDSISGWGYRKIKFKHGWDSAARLRTALALADRSPVIDGGTTSFRYVVNLPGGPRGVTCRQRVIVSFREDSRVPVGRHIITSFVDADG